MIRGFVLFVLGGVFGAAIGGMTVLFYYPFWFPPAEVNETVHAASQKQIVAHGQLIHPNPEDKVHWGKGSVTVYSSPTGLEVYLGADFEVGPGPDYHIYLIDQLDIQKPEQFDPDTALELGRLKSFKGGQVYAAPSDRLLNNQSVVVWCKRFRQLITSANLLPEAPR